MLSIFLERCAAVSAKSKSSNQAQTAVVESVNYTIFVCGERTDTPVRVFEGTGLEHYSFRIADASFKLWRSQFPFSEVTANLSDAILILPVDTADLNKYQQHVTRHANKTFFISRRPGVDLSQVENLANVVTVPPDFGAITISIARHMASQRAEERVAAYPVSIPV